MIGAPDPELSRLLANAMPLSETEAAAARALDGLCRRRGVVGDVILVCEFAEGWSDSGRRARRRRGMDRPAYLAGRRAARAYARARAQEPRP